MPERLLRIGELAGQAGVSTRTVDHYTGLGLLAPAGRSSGNFRLYRPGDAHRIRLIRTLEAHGLHLEDIAHALHTSVPPGCGQHAGRDCPADATALASHLDRLGHQLQDLLGLAPGPDDGGHGLLAAVTARAHALIATAAALAATIPCPGGVTHPGR